MPDTRYATNPLIVIAATTLILTCLLAIGVMTGIVPSPLAKERAATREVASVPTTAAQDSAAATQNAYAPTAPTPTARSDVAERVPPAKKAAAPAVGSTQSAAPSRTVSGDTPAPAARECTNCGSVVSVNAVKEQGEASMIGPAAGGLLGGVVGHQIGNGRGNTIATVLGAAGGAAAGTEIERRYKSKTHYVVAVRMNDGRVRHFNYAAAPGVQTGDRVRVVQGRLVRE
ncbi:MAG: glycine zipper 2TM domain-containing protein [Burkholderiales bacterium]